MNDLNEMIFRYDNSQHHPEIKTFPHHKHIFKCILEAKEPEMIDILIEIFEIIKEN